MARMLGRHRRHKVRDCRTMEHLCGRCSDGDETRAFKRREQRAVEREFTDWASWYATDEGRDWLDLSLAEASRAMSE